MLNTACNELYGKGQYTESARSLNRFATEEGYMQYSTSEDEGKHGVIGQI